MTLNTANCQLEIPTSDQEYPCGICNFRVSRSLDMKDCCACQFSSVCIENIMIRIIMIFALKLCPHFELKKNSFSTNKIT